MTRFATTLLVLGLLSGAEGAQRTDHPWAGVWVLDIERSTLPNANVKSQRLEIDVVPEGLKYRLVNIDQNDQERAREVILPLDGSDVTGGGGQRFSYRRVNEVTFERVNKDNAGRIVSVLRTEVSRDGKVLSQTTALSGASSPATGKAAGDRQIFTRRK